MGLLDDAIREHLELKRLRGADPGAVAREEHDALGPVDRGEHDALGAVAREEHDALGPVDRGGEGTRDWSDEDQPGVLPQIDDSLPPSTSATPTANPSDTGQETVEIDMDAVLDSNAESDSDPQAKPTPPPSSVDRAAPVAHPAHSRDAAEESLEWEMPGERLEDPAGDEDERGDDAEGDDDVLEETPDFLRDTPEQERLWFEQRPPRNFDFNE